jgi:hypothetical protein
MKSRWRRRVLLAILAIVFVGLFAERFLSSAGLTSIGMGLEILRDTFTAAKTDLEKKGFHCSQIRSSGDRPPVETFTCERANAQLTPPEDQAFRVEVVGAENRITLVRTHVCGSVARPCPTSSNMKVVADLASPSSIPPPNQPPPRSVTAGFAIFCLLMTTAWCLDWRHYVRFWLGRHPNYQGRWVLGLRCFFALSFFGSLQGALRIIFSHDWTLRDGEYAAFWLLVMTAAGALLDGIFRFRMGRPPVFEGEPSQF